MPVLLRSSNDRAPLPPFESWFATGPAARAFDPDRRLRDLARRLETAFEAIRDDWWALGRQLAAEPGGDLSHAASCAPSPSDFGTMMAWGHLVGAVAADGPTVLVVCDDPWLFRHLAGLPGVTAGPPPPRRRREMVLWLRGLAARVRVAARVAAAALWLRGQRRHHRPGGAFLMVYAHPSSDGTGGDAYFGDLLKTVPGLGRVLHTDASAARCRALAADGRSAAFHAWGEPGFAARLVATRWRPGPAACRGRWGWLVRRAAAFEGGGGAAAMTRWQQHCQRRWLDAVRPAVVAWPWENHPWERDFVRAARPLGVRTLGYLHTVSGRHIYNQSPHPNPDGLESVPDVLLCNGPGYAREAAALGMPAERMVMAGAIRFSPTTRVRHDPSAPFFVPLSSNRQAADQLLAAVRAVAAGGRHRFLVKTHPMYPFPVAESDGVRRTETPLPGHAALAGVIYCASVVGLEALLAGLPTVRFRTDRAVALDELPNALQPPTADADGLGAVLESLVVPPPLRWTDVFAPVDEPLWRRLLTPP